MSSGQGLNPSVMTSLSVTHHIREQSLSDFFGSALNVDDHYQHSVAYYWAASFTANVIPKCCESPWGGPRVEGEQVLETQGVWRWGEKILKEVRSLPSAALWGQSTWQGTKWSRALKCKVFWKIEKFHEWRMWMWDAVEEESGGPPILAARGPPWDNIVQCLSHPGQGIAIGELWKYAPWRETERRRYTGWPQLSDQAMISGPASSGVTWQRDSEVWSLSRRVTHESCHGAPWTR